jgi:hypothetical protein
MVPSQVLGAVEKAFGIAKEKRVRRRRSAKDKKSDTGEKVADGQGRAPPTKQLAKTRTRVREI